MGKRITKEQFDAGLENRMNRIAKLLQDQLAAIQDNPEHIDGELMSRTQEHLERCVSVFCGSVNAFLHAPKVGVMTTFSIGARPRSAAAPKATGQVRGKNAEALADKLIAAKRAGQEVDPADLEKLPARLRKAVETTVPAASVLAASELRKTTDAEPPAKSDMNDVSTKAASTPAPVSDDDALASDLGDIEDAIAALEIAG
jgi:hypothetical protein